MKPQPQELIRPSRPAGRAHRPPPCKELCGLWCVLFALRGLVPASVAAEGAGLNALPAEGGFVFPNTTNAVQFCLYTNASPQAPHVFNTFDITAYGQPLLAAPTAESLQRWQTTRTPGAPLHNICINGAGPLLASTNGLALIEQASGPEWQYAAFDVTGAYGDRLKDYRRSVLFVQPDLFVLHDHIVAREPVHFDMFLHPPEDTVLDTNWWDLRLTRPDVGFRINAPGRSGSYRFWERGEPLSDSILPGTVAMELGPTNQLERLDLITVYAVHPGGVHNGYDYYSFKLLESPSAVGARIHRAGLPTLVAFRLAPEAPGASLHGFAFEGPVGVSVFRPKVRTTGESSKH